MIETNHASRNDRVPERFFSDSTPDKERTPNVEKKYYETE